MLEITNYCSLKCNPQNASDLDCIPVGKVSLENLSESVVVKWQHSVTASIPFASLLSQLELES